MEDIKPKRRRVARKIAPFKKLNCSGDVKEIIVSSITPNMDFAYEEGRFKELCLYSEFINPLYLTKGHNSISSTKDANTLYERMSKINSNPELFRKNNPNTKKIREALWEKYVTSSNTNEPALKMSILLHGKDEIYNWLNFDENVLLEKNRHYGGSLINVSNKFGSKYIEEFRIFHLRSYNLTVSNLYAEIRGIIQVAFAILPKDYLYQKLHILEYNTIDLSRTTVLINNELNSPNFYCPAFRRLYKSYLEPYIKSTSCNVWMVPSEFIQKNCNIRPLLMTGKNIAEINENKTKLIEGFYGHLRNGKSVDIPGDLEEEYDYDGEDVYPDGFDEDVWEEERQRQEQEQRELEQMYQQEQEQQELMQQEWEMR